MTKERFKRGDRVRFQLAGRSMAGSVKEDRGLIGIQGRRLYLIEFKSDAQSSSMIELLAELLSLAGGTAAAR